MLGEVLALGKEQGDAKTGMAPTLKNSMTLHVRVPAWQAHMESAQHGASPDSMTARHGDDA